jgi:hypothetical protein
MRNTAPKTLRLGLEHFIAQIPFFSIPPRFRIGARSS